MKERPTGDEEMAAKAYEPPVKESGAGSAGAGEGGGEDAARTAGRGGLVIVAAKVMFILYGFAQQILLQHLLGAAGYGEVALVNASVGVVNNVMVAASIQGVSRTVAAAPAAQVGEMYRRVLGIHSVIAVVVAAAFAALSGPLAKVLHAEHVLGPMRVVALVVLLYGVYAPIVGSLNGRKRFVDQGGLDIAYGAMRTLGIALGVVLFLRAGQSGTLGFCVGFVAAAALIVPASIWRAGLGKPGGSEPSVGHYLTFLGPVVVAQGCLNLLLRTDFFLLRYFAGETAHAAGAPQGAADALLGVYQGVQLYAFLPYQLLMSITFILFPMLARAHADEDRGAVRTYTRTGVRLSFVFSGLICGTVAALPMHVLRMASPEAIWRDGAGALRILALGMGTLSVLGISSAVLTSLKREREAAGITLAAVALVAIACVAALSGAGLGEGMLVRTAIAASVGLGAAMLLGALLVRRAAGGFVPVATAVRVPLAIGAAMAAGWKMPWLGKVAVVPQAAAIGLVYVLALVVLREVGRDDLGVLRRAMSKKKGS
ncbi:MAG: lipopolysaccharide biosynthesis protein [Polyangiaceae bacterium]